MDSILCDERFPVIEDISKSDQNPISLLIVRESNTPAGFVKLQLIIDGVPCTLTNWPIVLKYSIPKECLKADSLGRLVLIELPIVCISDHLSRCKNEPALKHEIVDMVICFRCKTWPSMAKEWLTRNRLYEWPTKDTIQEIESLGCFVVKKGHPFSLEKDLEWRISLSLQERRLMLNLTDIQYKCYCALKMFNRSVIKLDYITSFHWKTCLLYVIKENNQNIWQTSFLCHNVRLCITQMLKWVKSGFCPNFFIPRDNLFDGKLNDGRRLVLAENKLKQLLDVGFRLDFELCRLLSDYPKSLENNKLFKWRQTRRLINENFALALNTNILLHAGCLSNIYILDKDYNRSNKCIATFINFLWKRLDDIHREKTVTEHTADETKSSLSLLNPFIYVSLASNISTMAIQHPNPQVRNFLLFGSFACLIKGDLSARLKFISVLYAIGLYEDCERFIEREDEHYIKNNPSVCICRVSTLDLNKLLITNLTTSDTPVCTCISFLPYEVLITPDAMKYEMFRYFGIRAQTNEKLSMVYCWNYRAVADCNVYFFLLKYLIKGRLRRYQESEEARQSITTLLSGTNVRHRDVACNLLAWTYGSAGWIDVALILLANSWTMVRPFCLYLSIAKEEMLQFQYNAAKLHALVLLYNTWFARKAPSIQFCFQCFSHSPLKLQKCSRCKIPTYCSKQCQRINWKIHKAVCKIVRSHQRL